MYHPFWVIDGAELSERRAPRELQPHESEGLTLPGRWVNSHELQAGDVVLSQDGRKLRVLKLEQEYQELFPVSNLTIEQDHNFAVGPDAVLVHNTGGCADAPKRVVQNQMFKHALQPFRGGFSNAGRALTKHPNIVGANSAQELIQRYGNNTGINKAAAKALKHIMRNGVQRRKTTRAFGDVIDFKLSTGLGARFNAVTSHFIGFLGRGV